MFTNYLINISFIISYKYFLTFIFDNRTLALMKFHTDKVVAILIMGEA